MNGNITGGLSNSAATTSIQSNVLTLASGQSLGTAPLSVPFVLMQNTFNLNPNIPYHKLFCLGPNDDSISATPGGNPTLQTLFQFYNGSSLVNNLSLMWGSGGDQTFPNGFNSNQPVPFSTEDVFYLYSQVDQQIYQTQLDYLTPSSRPQTQVWINPCTRWTGYATSVNVTTQVTAYVSGAVIGPVVASASSLCHGIQQMAWS